MLLPGKLFLDSVRKKADKEVEDIDSQVSTIYKRRTKDEKYNSDEEFLCQVPNGVIGQGEGLGPRYATVVNCCK